MALSEDGHRADLAVARKAFETGDLVLAGEICNRVLAKDPENVDALILLATAMVDADKSPIAIALAERAQRLSRNNWQAWMMLGAAEGSLERTKPAQAALRKALELNPGNPVTLRLLAHAYAIGGEYEKALKYGEQALAIEDHPQAHAALAFAYLHRREWAKGWDHYAHGMGEQRWRTKQNYGLPDWNGEPGRLLIYGEQGLGDQIAFCSAVQDVNAAHVVSNPKLANLLRRSLSCDVQGDQFEKEIAWPIEADYQCSMSELMRFTRRTPESFPGIPYLKPDRLRLAQWRWTFSQMRPRPKIGVAWTGGAVSSSGWATRNVTLGQLAPLFELDADFICLEYKDRSDELMGHKPKILDFPWATRSNDYDDTAALVAALDAVICVPTTVYHLAGALGIPAVVMVHDAPHFHEGRYGECPWWKSVHFVRGRTGNFVERAVEKLCECLSA